MEALDINSLSLHPEAETTPLMSREQYEALKEDLNCNGQLDPIILYRSRIIDGRHRWLILQELGISTINAIRLPNNSTLEDISTIVHSKETRRHETTAQLAIRAYRYSKTYKGKITQAELAKKFGVSSKRIGEVRKIIEGYKREDLIDTLFEGRKVGVGTTQFPMGTESLISIVNWLGELKATSKEVVDLTGIGYREELTKEEEILVSQFVKRLDVESNLVRLKVVEQLQEARKRW